VATVEAGKSCRWSRPHGTARASGSSDEVRPSSRAQAALARRKSRRFTTLENCEPPHHRGGAFRAVTTRWSGKKKKKKKTKKKKKKTCWSSTITPRRLRPRPARCGRNRSAPLKTRPDKFQASTPASFPFARATSPARVPAPGPRGWPPASTTAPFYCVQGFRQEGRHHPEQTAGMSPRTSGTLATATW